VRDEALLYDIIEMLVEIGEARGVSAAQVALACCSAARASPRSSSAPAPTTSIVRQSRRRPSAFVSTEERARLDQVSKLPLLYP